jgi:hypothetical protein
MNWNAWVLAALMLPCGMSAARAAEFDFKGQPVSADVRQLATWINETRDAAGEPIAIVDKKAARLYVFDRRHRLVGSTPVILGQTRGDHTVAGVGERAQLGRVGLNERTTPAGRFESTPGRNLSGEHIVWLDYDVAFAIHRLRPGPGHAERLAQLASRSPRDNRGSLGCVVVPVAFYDEVVRPQLGRYRGVVYVLPEVRSITGVFDPV